VGTPQKKSYAARTNVYDSQNTPFLELKTDQGRVGFDSGRNLPLRTVRVDVEAGITNEPTKGARDIALGPPKSLSDRSP